MPRPKGKREGILLAATEVFGTKGFHKANIIDIAGKAGIGKGTVYEYFKSKSSLFIEVIKFHADRYVHVLEQELKKGNSFNEKLSLFLKCHVKYMSGNLKAASIVLKNPVDSSIALECRQEVLSYLTISRNKIVALLESIFQQGREEGIVRDFDHNFAADMLLEMGTRCSLRAVFQKMTEKQIELQQEALINIFMRGVGSSNY